jgi:hypothetical protein
VTSPITRIIADPVQLTAAIQQGIGIENFDAPGGWKCDAKLGLNTANRLTMICLELPNIKQQSLDLFLKLPPPVDGLVGIIARARALDAKLESWDRTLPPIWRGELRRVITETPENPCEAPYWAGPVDTYEDLNIAKTVNDYRVSRVLCQTIVLRCIAALPSKDQTEQIGHLKSQAVYICRQMVNEFTSSVPYLLGFDYYTRLGANFKDEAAAKATGAFFAVGPLHITSNIPCVPSSQRSWLRGRLKQISQNFCLGEGGWESTYN